MDGSRWLTSEEFLLCATLIVEMRRHICVAIEPCQEAFVRDLESSAQGDKDKDRMDQEMRHIASFLSIHGDKKQD